MDKITLVAGGAGFLGSHLCEKLMVQDPSAQIVCVDNLRTGNLNNLNNVISNKNFRFHKADIIDGVDYHVTEVWNLACPASPPQYQRDPIHTFRSSVFGTYNLANLATSKNAKLFHVSTSEIYGDPTVTPQPEEYWGNVNPIGIRSCYDEGKRAAETVLFDLHRFSGLECKVVRVFNTYGPRMSLDDGRVISNFVVQALRGDDITIYGDGSQTRSFCYVDDLIDVFIKFMATDNNNPGPVNVGNPSEFTILELAEIVLSLTGSKSKLIFQKLPEDDPKQRCPDISKVKSLCSWEPKVHLEDGLRETIDYFRSVLAK